MEVCRTNYNSELIRFHAIIEKIKNQTICIIFNFNCNLWQQVPETNKSKPASMEHLNYGHISPHQQHIFWLQNFGVLWYLLEQCGVYPRDLSEISRGGRGGGNRGRVTTFWDCREGRGHEKWAVKRGRVMRIFVRDHVEVHPQKKKEVLYFVKKTWEK